MELLPLVIQVLQLKCVCEPELLMSAILLALYKLLVNYDTLQSVDSMPLRPVQVVTNAAHVQHTQLLEVLVYILCNLKLFDIFKRPIDSKNVYMEEMML